MAEQYWMCDFFVDLSRNQITQDKQTQTLPPKALAVLTYLAQNRGKVVSQEELLAEVWPDTIVAPNTLQRSIAQLRKALGDDGNVQSYIKTHAKRGYSLDCDVRWIDDPQSSSKPGTEIKSPPLRPAVTGISVLVGLVILSLIGFTYLAPAPTSQLVFDEIRSLTATDAKEFDATYTPDGQYIVFHRYMDKFCVNKLWAKNIKTQQEIPLTQDWGAYGSHSFSSDGKKLVFLATEACDEPVTQPNCYNLVQLDFEKALENPQQPNVVLQCKNSEVKKPRWLDDDKIALLQKHSSRWKLISYSVSENKSTDLYSLSEGNLVDFAYSAKDDLLAVISIRGDEQQYIDRISSNGRVLSSHQIKLPAVIPKFHPIRPNFDPRNQQLVFSTGRQLFTLSYDGQIEKISLPFAERMMQPEFHPDGRRILMIKGPYDSDIALLSLNQDTQRGTQTTRATLTQSQSYPIFERSNLGEDYGIFQPGGELIAFWSERSGDHQLWISDGDQTRQLTQFPMDTNIRGIDWAANGQSLLVNANNTLTQVTLDSAQKAYPAEHPVTQLFHWDSESNTALVLARIKGIPTFVEFDLKTTEMRVITDQRIMWASKTEDGRLIYKDHLNQFWRPGPAEAARIEALAGQGTRSDTFVIKGNAIYAINGEGRLWSYDLDSDSFHVLGQVTQDVDYLTDVSQTQLLMTIRVAAKKEVVELALRE